MAKDVFEVLAEALLENGAFMRLAEDAQLCILRANEEGATLAVIRSHETGEVKLALEYQEKGEPVWSYYETSLKPVC